MKEMKAHLVNIDNRSQGMGQRISHGNARRQVNQVDTQNPATGPNVTPINPRRNCYNCGSPDYFAKDCTRYRRTPTRPCDVCQEMHWTRDCPIVQKARDIKQQRSNNINTVEFAKYEQEIDNYNYYGDQYDEYA